MNEDLTRTGGRVRAIIFSTLLWVVALACLASVILPAFLDRRYYDGPHSDHYDGARFRNPGPVDTAGQTPVRGNRAGFLWAQATGNDGRPPWPETVVVAQAKPAARVTGDRMVATWVGHATVLIQTQGLNILTDPVWSAAAGPFGFGPARVARPGIAFDDLPRIDLIVVSHNHYDHMDLTTLKRLWDRDRPRIITSLGNDAVIGGADVPATALDWGGRMTLRPGIDVHVVRNHHWSSRWFADRNRALWSSFVVTLPGGNLFFAGDTGLGDARWPEEAAALGPVRLALIPIGAFRFVPGQMETGSHIGPAQAVEVFARMKASRAIAVHWGTFRLSYEAWATPPKLLDAAMRCAGRTGFDAVRQGAPVEVGAYAPVTERPVVANNLKTCLDTPAVKALR